MKALKNLRRKKMIAQGGRCFYCDLPMWDEAMDACLPLSCKSSGLLKTLRCTAEHLHPRSEGGADTADNIVAACWYCNTSRHRRKRPLSPEAHRAHVQKRMGANRWLAASVPRVWPITIVAKQVEKVTLPRCGAARIGE